VCARVEEVASNLARLAPLELLDVNPGPAAAVLTGVARRMPVFVEGSDELCRALRSTAWLEVGDGRHGLKMGEGEILVIDREGERGIIRLRDDDEGQRRALELLEDRARAARLLEHVDALPESKMRCPIEWEVGIERELVVANTEIAPDTALWIKLRNTDPASGNWFASVILIDPIGRPLLLNSSQNDGVELDQGTDEYIGHRPSAARRGVVIDWPGGIVERGSGRVRLVLLASKRPIQLGHLVQQQPSSRFEALRMQGFQAARKRADERVFRSAIVESPSPKMVLSEGWAAQTFDLLLRAP
jgi:hypothetical protein